MEPMSESDLTAEVVERFNNTPNERLREIIQSLVTHLHAFARDVRLTDDEWMAGIQFLTAAGHITDDVRQEFILLSDTLGLSSLIDIINHGSDNEKVTEPTILGPFYVPNSPVRDFGASMIEFDDGGEVSIVSGRVLDVAGQPIAGATLDVWQNSANGFYAVQQPDVQPATNLRGVYSTDSEGRYEFRTVRPTPYPIPDDGPVGKMLAATGRHQMRAAHIHIMLSAPGYVSLTTHVFDDRSEYLDSDTVFGVKGSLIRSFTPGDDELLHCATDFVLDGA
jgi:catechol 1,2-dioxygenase